MIIASMAKFFSEFMRSKFGLTLVIFMPMSMLFFVNLLSGGVTTSGPITYNTTIINNDLGIPEPSNDIETGFYTALPTTWQEEGVGQELIDIIFNIYYQENGTDTTPIFNKVETNNVDTAIDSLRSEEVALVVVIPENFTLLVIDLLDNGIDDFDLSLNISQTILMHGMKSNPDSTMAGAIMELVINGFLEGISNSGASVSPDSITVSNEFVRTWDIDITDYMVVYFAIMASILGSAGFAAFLADDQEKGTINRIKLSPNSPMKYLLGFSILVFIVSMIQFGAYFAFAKYVMKFDPAGSNFRAFITLMILTIASLGLIFMAGSIARSSTVVVSVLIVTGFLLTVFVNEPSGLILLRDVLSFTSGSPDLSLWDLLPWIHARYALQGIFFYDRTFTELSGDMIMLTITTLVWFVTGLYLYTKRRFAREG